MPIKDTNIRKTNRPRPLTRTTKAFIDNLLPNGATAMQRHVSAGVSSGCYRCQSKTIVRLDEVKDRTGKIPRRRKIWLECTTVNIVKISHFQVTSAPCRGPLQFGAG